MNSSGFIPGQHPIDSYGNGGFRFGGMSHRGSLLALPSGTQAIEIVEGGTINEALLAPLWREPPGAVELLLVGTGLNLIPLPELLRWALRTKGIRFEPMPTGAAARTYNILLGEKRLVAALLVAVP